MPINLQAIAYNALFTQIQLGVANYNAAIAAGTIVGSRAVAAGNLLNFETTGRVKERITRQAPNSFPMVALELMGDTERTDPMLTFANMQGQQTDTIIARSITMEERITYAQVGDNFQTPLESYLDQAIRLAWPKFGIPYLRPPTFNGRRRDESVDAGSAPKVVRTVMKRTWVFEMRPHLSLLLAS